MRQQLVKNLLFVLVVNILVKTIWIFFIDRNVQLHVGYSAYGSFQALFNLGMIFQILLDFGLTQYNSKEIATDPKRLRVLFSSMFWTRCLFILVYVLLVLGIGLALGYRGVLMELLLGVLLIQSFNSMLLFLRSSVAALHHFRTDGVLAVIDRLLMILLCGTLLLLPATNAAFTIEWFVWSQVACYFIAILIAFFILMRISPVPIHFSIRPQMIQKVLRQSLPFALHVFLMSIYMRSDAVLIDQLCGTEGKMQAGIYASAFRLLDVANIFGVMFAGMLMPIFSKMIAKQENVASTIRLSVDIMMPIAFVVAIVAVFFGKDIMYLLYHKSSAAQDAQIFTILMCSFPAYCLMYIYSTLLTAKGSLTLLNTISFFIVLLNLALHFYFIPQFFAAGAAIAVLITEWMVAALVIYFAHRVFELPHNIPWLLKHIAFVLTVLLMAFVVQHIDGLWYLRLFIMMLGVLCSVFLFRFWTINSLKALLGRKNSFDE